MLRFTILDSITLMFAFVRQVMNFRDIIFEYNTVFNKTKLIKISMFSIASFIIILIFIRNHSGILSEGVKLRIS